MKTAFFIALLAVISLQSLAQRSTAARRSKHDWEGRNILTVQPFGFVVAYSKFNPAAGIDYERIVSKKLGLGIHVPIMFGFIGPEQDFNNDGYQQSIFYTAPGIRFHVGGKGRQHVDFSTGASVIIGNQHYKYVSYYGYNPGPSGPSYNLTVSGIAADNVLNIQRGQFIFGFNSRIGYTFDRQNSAQLFLDLGMHFGGRFL